MAILGVHVAHARAARTQEGKVIGIVTERRILETLI